jgi:RNA polymerase sigma factor (TIGR02999 family)
LGGSAHEIFRENRIYRQSRETEVNSRVVKAPHGSSPDLQRRVAGENSASIAGPGSLPDFIGNLLPVGKDPAMDAALPAVYDELRQLAASYLRRERSDHTLQPTALVHESYLRLLNQKTVDWSNRLEFLSIAARMMRRILSDHATARAAEKRGGGAPKLQLDAALEFCSNRAIDIAAVDEALRDLEAMDPRQAQLVELRFFGGLTIEETAELMALSPATVKREWMTARRWLQREIAG